MPSSGQAEFTSVKSDYQVVGNKCGKINGRQTNMLGEKWVEFWRRAPTAGWLTWTHPTRMKDAMRSRHVQKTPFFMDPHARLTKGGLLVPRTLVYL